uniref:Uncharacterized protein n=1 Tax=Palpitomonas bilix TaxID=652834 RepID=A0A7S3GD66_9EUKA|mmetsp:Transcript_44315/g.115167  ORF Transcript_44315/g.115167 Transcript_44315/m.115167 type:complete len:548 (+) Transcript_44315:161-1804(+)
MATFRCSSPSHLGMSLLLLWLVLSPPLAVGFDTSPPVVPDNAYSIEDVQFQSLPARSGQITLHGKVFRPSPAIAAGVGRMRTTGPFSPNGNQPLLPAVLLITGSGPTNMYESEYAQTSSGAVMTVEPFFDIASYLAASGAVVLTYNKRSCFAGPLCSANVMCTATVTTDCVNVAEMVFDDFVSDGVSALNYLSALDGVDTSDLSVIGHSQGCTVAPMVAARTGTVRNIALLMGSGVDEASLLSLQAQRQMGVYEYSLSLMSPTDPNRAAVERELALANCTAQIVPEQTAALLAGKMGRSDAELMRSVVLSGGYANTTTGEVVCPRQCNGEVMVCSATMTDPHCKAQCEGAALKGMAVSSYFAYSWYNASTMSARTETYTTLSLHSSSPRILSMNSWTDLLVVPAVFQPLHTLLQQDLPGTFSYAAGNPTNIREVVVHIFPNLTHLMTPYPPNPYPSLPIRVEDRVLSKLAAWLYPTYPADPASTTQIAGQMQAADSRLALAATLLGVSTCVLAVVAIVLGVMMAKARGKGRRGSRRMDEKEEGLVHA